MTSETDVTRPDTGLIRALHVSGPDGAHAAKLMLFGQFVGSWQQMLATRAGPGQRE